MRLLHKIYANLLGYFWLPCPVCGKMFGGHEISKVFTTSLIAEDGRAYSVCADPQCNHDAAVLNMSCRSATIMSRRNAQSYSRNYETL